MTPDFAQLGRALGAEAALVLGALAVLTLDIAVARRATEERRRRFSGAAAVAATIGALAVVGCFPVTGSVFGDVLAFDTLATVSRVGILGLALLAVGVAAGVREPGNAAEYVAMMLFATTGMTMMAAANHLLVAFLALETVSLSLYILTGFARERAESAEAGLKYFLYGGMAAAFLLFGISLLYGLTGSFHLPAIASNLGAAPFTPLLAVALVMIAVGLGFKVAAAPFHLWAPDAYQGAPATAAGLVASASKLAALVLFVRLLWAGLRPVSGEASVYGVAPGWAPIVAALALASLLLGNLVALAQTDVRRLLAYSAIAHAGAMLLGVLAAGRVGPGPLVYYAITYGIATVGIFGLLAVLQDGGVGMKISHFAGLSQRSPWAAGLLAIYLLSLAGIPPLAGFFGKFVVFAAALQADGLGSAAGLLALAAIGLSAVGLYYYLIVLKQAFVVPPAEGAGGRVALGGWAMVWLVLAAGLLVALGAWPSLVLRWL